MSTDSNNNFISDCEQNAGPFAPLPRPMFQLRSLPIEYRWEVSRRHPYYLQFWSSAQRHHRGEPCSDPREPLLRQFAVAILTMIGVSGEAVSPETSFAQLGADQLNKAWLSGAVHPITFRGLSGLLIASLPKETLATLGRLLLEASCEDVPGNKPRKIESLVSLAEEQKPGLNSFPDEPIVSINPAASRRQITESAATLLKDWKGQRELTELRDRSDKYPEYLQVWDLREGWNGGDYDIAKERTLRQVAGELRIPIATANKHYRSAFEMITGHSYSPEIWLRVFGPFKIFGREKVGPVSRRRPLKSRTHRDVPESVLQSNSADEDGPAISALRVDQNSWIEQAEIIWDIKTLIDMEKTDEEILEELELAPSAKETIAYVRNRGEGP